MQNPQFSFQQYLDSNTLNTAMNEITSGVGDFTGKTFYPGLVRPDIISITINSQELNADLPSPFGIQFGSGLFSTAHGIVNGVDTQNYTVSFSSLFPSSGSITAYLLASYSQVYQNPIIITGPPVGHQAYDPAFVPYTAYTIARDTLALSASTGLANNNTTFELARCTLTASSGAISNLVFNYQSPASPAAIQAPLIVNGNTNLSYPSANSLLINIAASGTTITLPLAVSNPGAIISALGSFSAGTSSITVSGSDQIFGFQQESLVAINVSPRAFISLESDGTNWNAKSINPNTLPLIWPAASALPSPISISTSGGINLPYSSEVEGNLSVTQNTALSGTLTVNGEITAAGSNTGLTVNNNLSVLGTATDNALNVTNDAAVGVNLTVSGSITTLGSVSALGPLSPNGAFNTQVFTTGGTFTVPSGVNRLRVRLWGGGGGGGGSSTGSGTFIGSGGGGGGYSEYIGLSVTPQQEISVNIGSGGSGGPNNTGATGGTGGTSSFGGYMSATGGAGGTGWASGAQAGGVGGVGSGGTLNLQGGQGSAGFPGTSRVGGVGGASPMGGGGGATSDATPSGGSIPGGGGGGGGSSGSQPGGVGAGGLCIVEW